MFLSVLPGVVVSNVSLVGQSRTKTTYSNIYVIEVANANAMRK